MRRNLFYCTWDEAAEVILQSEGILLLLGSVEEHGYHLPLGTDVLLAHDGIAMGYSAGALVQLAEYHLSPDTDYPRFTYQKGIPYLHGFYLEVHYEGTEE